MTTIRHTELVRVQKFYSDGLSAREIAERLGASIHAVYYFMEKSNIRRRDRTTSNLVLFHRKPLTYCLPVQWTKELESLKQAGVLLYWSEGAKIGKSIDFANSDVAMCKIFMRFLREVCGIKDEKKLRGYIYCHEGQNQTELIAFWSKELSLPREQFTKPYVRRYPVQKRFVNKRPKRMVYGLMHIRYADMKLLSQINAWIKECQERWVGSEVDKRVAL